MVPRATQVPTQHKTAPQKQQHQSPAHQQQIFQEHCVFFFFNLLPICEIFVLRINKLKEICPKGSLSSPSPSLNYTQPVQLSRKLEKLLKTLRVPGLEWSRSDSQLYRPETGQGVLMQPPLQLQSCSGEMGTGEKPREL